MPDGGIWLRRLKKDLEDDKEKVSPQAFLTKRTTINYMLLGGGGSPEKNTFLILAKHQRTRQSDNGMWSWVG